MTGSLKRLAYAFVGLLVGDAMLLLYILQGAPKDQIAGTLDVFTLYAIFSLVGWLFVGVPVALFLPVRWVIRWPWPLAITLGAFLGPPALLVILTLLGHGRIHFAPLRETGLRFAFSILVSTVSFGVYVGLLRRQYFCNTESRVP